MSTFITKCSRCPNEVDRTSRRKPVVCFECKKEAQKDRNRKAKLKNKVIPT